MTRSQGPTGPSTFSGRLTLRAAILEGVSLSHNDLRQRQSPSNARQCETINRTLARPKADNFFILNAPWEGVRENAPAIPRDRLTPQTAFRLGRKLDVPSGRMTSVKNPSALELGTQRQRLRMAFCCAKDTRAGATRWVISSNSMAILSQGWSRIEFSGTAVIRSPNCRALNPVRNSECCEQRACNVAGG